MKTLALSALLLISQASLAVELICIAGGSASGKTTYAKKLKAQHGDNAVLLEFDRYFIDIAGTIEDKLAFNWDHPNALDWTLVKEHLMLLKVGQPIEVPVRDFTKFARAEHTETLKPAEIIIFEGIHALHDQELRSICNRKVFVDASEELRLARRIKRDVHERGVSPENTLKMFEKSVKPMHDEFIEPVKNHDGVEILSQEDI